MRSSHDICCEASTGVEADSGRATAFRGERGERRLAPTACGWRSHVEHTLSQCPRQPSKLLVLRRVLPQGPGKLKRALLHGLRSHLRALCMTPY